MSEHGDEWIPGEASARALLRQLRSERVVQALRDELGLTEAESRRAVCAASSPNVARG